MALQVGPVSDDDVAALVILEAQATPWGWNERQLSDSRAAGHKVLCVRDAGVPVAYAVTSQVLDEAELLNIVVALGHQGRGVATLLLSALLDDMRQQGALRCFLEVRESNVPAQALYRRAGFEVVGRRTGYYPAVTGREDALLMALNL